MVLRARLLYSPASRTEASPHQPPGAGTLSPPALPPSPHSQHSQPSSGKPIRPLSSVGSGPHSILQPRPGEPWAPLPGPPLQSSLKLLQARTQSARVLYPHRLCGPQAQLPFCSLCVERPSCRLWQTPIHPPKRYSNGISSQYHDRRIYSPNPDSHVKLVLGLGAT